MLYHLDALIAFVGVILLASLIVTAGTQIVIALLNLRGRNLLWGLKRLVVQIAPSLAEDADAVVRKILTNPLVASDWRIKRSWARALKLPSVIRREEFSRLLVMLAHSKEMDAFEERVKKGVQALATGKLKELEAWFDHVADRLSQRFSRNSKIIAVCGAILVVVFFRLDSIQLMKSVNSDQELRARLLSSIAQIQATGDAVLGGPTIYDMAFQALQAEYPEFKMPAQSIISQEGAGLWLQNNKPAGVEYEELLNEYQSALSEAAQTKLGTLGNDLVTANAALGRMGLEIFGKEKIFGKEFMARKKLLGFLISIILLSFGAPFWFNVLKNLTNLRSRLMQNEEKERQKRLA